MLQDNFKYYMIVKHENQNSYGSCYSFRIPSVPRIDFVNIVTH
jgi:hypothetical protein